MGSCLIKCTAPSKPAKHPQRRRPSENDGQGSPSLQPIDFGVPISTSFPSLHHPPTSTNGLKAIAPTAKLPVAVSLHGHQIRETLPIPFILQQPEEQTDNWDDDFEEGISLTKLQGMYNCNIKLYLIHTRTSMSQRWRNYPRKMRNPKSRTMDRQFAPVVVLFLAPYLYQLPKHLPRQSSLSPRIFLTQTLLRMMTICRRKLRTSRCDMIEVRPDFRANFF